MSDLPIIGREKRMVDKLTQQLHRSIRGHAVTPIREERRGSWFEVMFYEGKEPSNRIARVTVEFDRIEAS